MRIGKRVARLLASGALLLAVGPATASVGRFAVVQNRVTSQKTGAAAVPAAPGAAIDLGEVETTGGASAAKMTFGEGAVISLGQNTTFKVTSQEVSQATGASTSSLDLLVGKARVFVSRFWSGRPEVEVTTPTAVVGIKGSEVVVEVAEDGGTTVTVLSGEAKVTAKADPGASRTLAPAERIAVPKQGRLPAGPASASPAMLADLRDATEPDPWAPRELPGNKPTKEPPPVGAPGGGSASKGQKTRFAGNTTATSSSGALWNDPATGVPPDFSSGQRGQ